MCRLILFLAVVILCLNSSGSILTHNYYGLREAYEEEIPQGAATLAFVFDITGSMYDDLVQVIAGAARILSTILARREKAIYNYVLVPFHDPDIGPVTVTTDPDLFQRQLKELYVQGGGDCPEMSIGAIKLALEVCLPNSHIYVFTDARAKDYYLLDDVLKLIQRKQSQVVFVMTGDCGNHSHPGYQAYERIASTSSGQVFHLMKSDVDEVLNFVRVSLQARKVNLFAVDRKAGDMRQFEFDIDGSLREFTISVSGENPVITIIDSKGEVIDQRRGLLELLNHKNISIINIKDPQPGRWKLRVNSEGSHTIRATGLSKIDFVHGFSRQPTANLKETYHRPLKGAPTYLLVNATDLPSPATFKNVKIVDLEGNNLQNIPLQRFPGSNLFNASTFYPPNEYFYLKIAGSDEYGYPIERMTSTAISAQLPDAPEVNTRSRMIGYYDEDTDLRCYIQSLVPFSVTWYKDGVPISQEQHFPQTTEIVLTVPEVNMLSEGYYSCNATNIAGRASSVIFLDVKEPPPSISKIGNITGILSSATILPCEVDSVVNYNVTWTKVEPDEKNIGFVKSVPIPDTARFIIYQNNSLLIKDVMREDEGWYKCTAANDGGVSQELIYLHTYYPPVVSVSPKEKNFVTGEFINITCKATGYPEPNIRWLWSQAHENNFRSGKSEVQGKNLIIYSADPEDEGRYDCVARNTAGTQVVSAILNYIEAPVITLPEKEILVKNGEQAILRCIAEGIPDPKVIWLKGSVEVQPLSYIQVTPDGSLLIYDVQETDVGSYTCVAENEAGSVNETMYLNVGSKPSLIKLPSTASVDILQSTSVPCIGTGTPKPHISWHFENGSLILGNAKFSVTPEGSLLIQDADLSIIGKYICRAENKFGMDEQIVELLITGIKKPILSPIPAIINVPKGEKRTVSCTVLEGNPKPEIMFLKNDVPIQSGHGITVKEEKLEFFRADEHHEANYSCFASNIGGNATEEFYINILYQPVISTHDQHFLAVEGSSLTLPCNVKAEPKPTILWFKNEIELASNRIFHLEHDGSLTIQNISEEEGGEYVCAATNIIGTSKQVYKLTVNVPPRIEKTDLIYNITANHLLVLPCNSYAVPAASIKWYRKGRDNQTINMDKYMMYNGSLQFRPKFNDSGTYTCQATNEAGQAQLDIVLNVHVQPSAHIKTAGMAAFTKGDTISIACEVSGEPRPETYWIKDGTKLAQTSLISIQDNTVKILNSTLIDEGTYTCIAKNLAGTASDKVFISVYEAPKINSEYSSSSNIFAVVGDAVDMSCNASGHPKPNIIWKEPRNDLIHNIQNGILHIPFVQESDAGSYSCIAQNAAGSDTRSFILSVYAPPVLLGNQENSVDIFEGQDTSFDCTTTAMPLPEVLWYKDGEIISQDSQKIALKSSNQILQISDVHLSDSGHYVCIVKNPVGETSNNFKLTVSVAPSFKTDYEKNKNVVKNHSVTFDCTAAGFPEPVYIWRKKGQFLASIPNPRLEFTSEKNILSINEIKESDAGTYTCVAMNKVGSVNRDFEYHLKF